MDEKPFMSEKKTIIVDAPSNLGLSPPGAGMVPGCYKLPWALRNRNLLTQLNAEDGGCIIPPRYEAFWEEGDGDRNADAIGKFSSQLANRIEPLIDEHQKILVLGGDCSILIGTMMALKRKGRYGLVFLDAHSDFRHPGNAKAIGAAAGEDLAIVTGRGDKRLVNIDNQMPYVLEQDIHIVGVRSDDDYIQELKSIPISCTTSDEWLTFEGDLSKEIIRNVSENNDGFWIHLDCDVIDQSEMPAVDCPEKDGPSFNAVTDLLGELIKSPKCVGMEVTIYDPDIDPNGTYADSLTDCLVQAFSR